MRREPDVDLSPTVSDAVKFTTCYMCACRCGIKVHLRDGLIRYIEGNRNHPVNRGVLCGKGSSGVMQHYSPARLRKPLKRVGGRRDDARPASLGAVVSLLERLVGGQIGGRVGGRESAQRAGQQGPVAALELESVMGARRANARGHFGMTVQGVGGDDTAFQIKALQHFQRRGDLVAVRARASRYLIV